MNSAQIYLWKSTTNRVVFITIYEPKHCLYIQFLTSQYSLLVIFYFYILLYTIFELQII